MGWEGGAEGAGWDAGSKGEERVVNVHGMCRQVGSL